MSESKIERLLALMKVDSDPADAAKAGVWFEPRSLWHVHNIDMAKAGGAVTDGVGFVGPTLNVHLPRNPFRNGTRHPITINRIAISGVGYPFARPDAGAMQAGPFGEEGAPNVANMNGTSMINALRVSIASPYVRTFMQSPSLATGMSPRPTGDPTVDAGLSSLFGTTALRFDKPLIVPKNGQIEWGLSSLQGMQFIPTVGEEGSILTPTPLSSADMQAVLSYMERGGLFPGSARSRLMSVRTNPGPNVPVPGVDGWPYALPPGFFPLATGATIPFWDPTMTFDTQTYRAANVTRAGSTDTYGMNVSIDQSAFDDAVLEDFPAAKIAPVSTRIGSRVRLRGGPADGWWWTPGAPLALVLDTLTPASVYWFDEPITLRPGDALDVTVSVNTGALLNSEELPQNAMLMNASSYQFGISFNGYSAIDG